MFKYYRLIFVLIGLEFLVINVFFIFNSFISEDFFYFFMCFSVISRVLGILVILNSVKFFGSDLCVY